MCSVSMIGDYYGDKWRNQPWFPPQLSIAQPILTSPPYNFVSREEFDALKKEVLEMKELLRRAKIYDEKNGEPNCEIDEKMDTLRKVAKLFGVELDDVLKPK